MAVQKVLRMGDARLLQVSEPVQDFDTVELHALIQDLFDTMASREGAGLAAPQIGILKRVVVFGIEKNPRYPDAEAVPMTVLINPEIKSLSKVTDDAWEGCLSVPGLRGLVPRYTHIWYRGYDPFGRLIEREVRDFHARVVQHECDHLDGILYPRRIRDLRHFGFESELFSAKEEQSGAES